MTEPIFTGERVVPNNTCHAQTMAEHLIRYAFATRYAKVGKILDVACGTGYGLKIMGMLGAEKYGGDIDSKSVGFANDFVYSDEDKNGTCRILNFEDKSDGIDYFFGKKEIDLITSFETIEHLEDPNLFLQGIKDCLKDDGKFVYSIPLVNPSKYHKVVYTFQEAYDIITKYFDHEEIFIQEGVELVNFERVKGNLDNLNKRGIFIIGVCHKKK